MHILYEYGYCAHVARFRGAMSPRSFADDMRIGMRSPGVMLSAPAPGTFAEYPQSIHIPGPSAVWKVAGVPFDTDAKNSTVIGKSILGSD